MAMHCTQDHGRDNPTADGQESQQALRARAYRKWQHWYQVP